MDQVTIDVILTLLEQVRTEYTTERSQAGPDDPYTEYKTRHKLATVERIRAEIMVLSGRLPEGATY